MKERDSLHIKLAHQVGGAIACLLALALLLGLTACGSGQAQQPQPEPPAVADEQTKIDEPEPDVVPEEPVPADPEETEDDEHDGFPETEGEPQDHPVGLSFTQEEFDQLVADTLDRIIKEDMTPMEQARAVFDYVYANIHYTGMSDKSDWMTGAYDGLTTGKGDCFTYYAVSRALLTALEIDNLEVRRIEGTSSRHYWNLVNCGDGWYHFDACPRSVKMPSFLSFMVTDQQVADFTAMAGRHYYDFDDTLLPERATEIVTHTRPIPRPPVEEEDPEAEDPNEADPDEPILPPDEPAVEPGDVMADPADGTDPNAGGDPGDNAPPADSGEELPVDVWTEPPAEEWPEPSLDGGEDAGNAGADGYGEMEAG